MLHDDGVNQVNSTMKSGVDAWYKHYILEDYDDYIEDQFSISNNNAKLTYKVGLMSSPEANILNNSNARKTGQWYWLVSPTYFVDSIAGGRCMSTSGIIGGVRLGDARGVRPAVSLTPGIEYSGGDGSMANPYKVELES